MSERNCNDCKEYYPATIALVAILWLAAAAVAFWYLKLRRAGGAKENASTAQEMIKVPEGNQDVIYREVAFNTRNKKAKGTKSTDITYAEISKASKQDDGLIYSELKHNAEPKKNNATQHTEPEETTYAEIKQMSEKAEPADGSKDTYACVIKKKKLQPPRTKT